MKNIRASSSRYKEHNNGGRLIQEQQAGRVVQGCSSIPLDTVHAEVYSGPYRSQVSLVVS